MKMFSTLALVAAAALFTTGCQSGNKDACAGKNAACCKEGEKSACTITTATANSMCVMAGGPVNPSVTSEFKGTKVGFCCAGCQTKFNAMSDADKTTKLAKSGVAVK